MSSSVTSTPRGHHGRRRRPKDRRRGGGGGPRRRGRRTTTTMTTVGARGPRLPCNVVESADMNCLNGGQCFVVLVVQDIRTPGCRCVGRWTGRQCERRAFQFDFSQAGHGDTLAVGVAFAIVFIFLAVFTAVLGSAFYCWFRKQQQTSSKRYHHPPSRDVERAPTDVTALTSQYASSKRQDNVNTSKSYAAIDGDDVAGHQKSVGLAVNDHRPLKPSTESTGQHDDISRSSQLPLE